MFHSIAANICWYVRCVLVRSTLLSQRQWVNFLYCFKLIFGISTIFYAILCGKNRANGDSIFFIVRFISELLKWVTTFKVCPALLFSDSGTLVYNLSTVDDLRDQVVNTPVFTITSVIAISEVLGWIPGGVNRNLFCIVSDMSVCGAVVVSSFRTTSALATLRSKQFMWSGC